MTMRISGLASGMDIDSMVSNLMKAEKMPQTKLKQQKDKLTFQTELYREINVKMASLRDAVNGIKYNANFAANKVSSSTTDISATASSSASAVSHFIKVNSLATAESRVSADTVSNVGLTGAALGATTVIEDGKNKFNISVDGISRTITLDNGSYSRDELQAMVQSKINAAYGANRLNVSLNGNSFDFVPVGTTDFKPQVVVNDAAGNTGLSAIGLTNNQSFKLNLGVKLSTIGNLKEPLSVPAAGGSFTINGVKIDYSSDDTMQSIINRVNSSSANVTMSYDPTADKFSLMNKTTGADAHITLSDDTGKGNFLDATGLLNGQVNLGTDASVEIDGITSQRATNAFTLDGVSYTLNNVNKTGVTVNIQKDNATIVGNIKKMVDAYNDMIDLVNRRLSEQKSKGYDPLTTDQKSDMSDSDIELWNTEAKKGLIHNDNTLKKVKSSLRELFIKDVSGVADRFNSLYDIGITTVPYVQGQEQDAGKLTIDETKLNNAITQDPNAVISLFTQTSDDNDNSNEGIAVSMYEKTNSLLSELTKKAGREGGSMTDRTITLGSQMYNLQLKIDDWDTKLSKMEDNYYKRFSAMEKAVSNGNSQLSWLQKQFG